MSKIVGVFILAILSISLVSALRINEVELNSPGNDQRTVEWIELYSEDTVNLAQYALEIGTGKNRTVYELNEYGEQSGFFTIEHAGWLVNNRNTIRLMIFGLDGNWTVVDETEPLTDRADDTFAWSACSDGSWHFVSATPGSINQCVIECTADINKNGMVEFGDLNMLLSVWGCTGSTCVGDIIPDHKVNDSDMDILLAEFGSSCYAN